MRRWLKCPAAKCIAHKFLISCLAGSAPWLASSTACLPGMDIVEDVLQLYSVAAPKHAAAVSLRAVAEVTAAAQAGAASSVGGHARAAPAWPAPSCYEVRGCIVPTAESLSVSEAGTIGVTHALLDDCPFSPTAVHTHRLGADMAMRMHVHRFCELVARVGLSVVSARWHHAQLPHVQIELAASLQQAGKSQHSASIHVDAQLARHMKCTCTSAQPPLPEAGQHAVQQLVQQLWQASKAHAISAQAASPDVAVAHARSQLQGCGWSVCVHDTCPLCSLAMTEQPWTCSGCSRAAHASCVEDWNSQQGTLVPSFGVTIGCCPFCEVQVMLQEP